MQQPFKARPHEMHATHVMGADEFCQVNERADAQWAAWLGRL